MEPITECESPSNRDRQVNNAIPDHAGAFIDERILPRQTRNDFIQALRQRYGQEVESELYDNQFNSGQELSSSTHTVSKWL